MLRQHATLFRRLMIFTDLCIAAGAFFLAYYVRNQIDAVSPLLNYLWILPVLICTWGIFLYFSGMYASFRLKKMTEVFLIIGQASCLSFFVFSGLCYALKTAHISRGLIFLSFIFTMIFLALEKIALIYFFRRLRRKGFNYKNVLIVGTGKKKAPAAMQRSVKIISLRNNVACCLSICFSYYTYPYGRNYVFAHIEAIT